MNLQFPRQTDGEQLQTGDVQFHTAGVQNLKIGRLIMARTRISRDLGALPRRSALIADRDKSRGGLQQILRSLALKNQREQPTVFYSLREVAKRFKVPISNVARIYHDMEQEGLLSRVRGSKTVLNGLRNNRRLSVRAFIGLPALISNFVTIQDYRTFFICLRRELWSRGFAAAMVFFRPVEAADGRLSEQLKSYGFDTVIWLQPGRTAKETFLRLSDMGVRFIGITQIGTPSIPSRYYVWREHAIEVLLKDWRDRNSIRKITVVDSSEYRSAVTEEIVRVILHNLEMETSIRTWHDEDPSVFLGDLCRFKTDGIVFSCAGLTSMFAFRSADKFIELLRTQRVALADGPIDVPFIKVPDVAVDLVSMNWRALAEVIVNDLISREAFDRNRYTTFEAEAEFRVPLTRICDEFRPLRSMGSPP